MSFFGALLACSAAFAAAPKIKTPGTPRISAIPRATLVSSVTADNTLNTTVTQSGSTFIITGGTLQKTNLFQSLSSLDLAAGDTARFVADPSVTNILARVTSGQPSNIDGTLQTRLSTDQTQVHTANLFLLNPAGVIFGPDASLDLGGAFAVTSADSVRLKDGTQFNASTTANPILRTSSPAAFGFVNPTPATITVNGTHFTMPSGAPLSIVGGDIVLSGGTLTIPGGRLNTVAVASQGEVALDAVDPSAAPPDVSAFSKLGTVNMVSDNVVNLDNATGPGGSVYIRAGSLNLAGSQIASRTLGGFAGEKGGPIDIQLTDSLTMIGDLTNGTTSIIKTTSNSAAASGDITITATDINVLDNSAIATSASAAGDGGAINLNAAHTILLDDLGSGSIAYVSTFTGDTDPTILTGACGPIRLNAGSLSIHGAGAAMYTLTETNAPPGRGGSITGNVNTVTIAAAGSLETDSYASATGGDIQLRSKRINLVSGGTLLTDTFADGTGGSIGLTCQTLSLSGGANLFTTTQGSGTGGSVHISADSISLTDSGTVVGTTTQGNGSLGGNSGDLFVDAGNIDIMKLARLSNVAFGSSRTGDMHIHADRLTVVGVGSSTKHHNTGVILGTNTGSNGDMKLTVGTLTLRDGVITGVNNTAAPGGIAIIHAENEIAMTGRFSFIATSVGPQGTGHGGDLTLETPVLHIRNGAQLLVGTTGAAPAGLLQIDTGSQGAVLIDGPLTGITAQTLGVTPDATAGSVHIRSGSFTMRNDSVIFASAFNLANGGDIQINADTINLNNSAISVATEGSGNGGSANLFARRFNLFNDGEVDAVAVAAGNGGKITLTGDLVNLDTSGHLTSQATGTGEAGDVTVNAELHMNGQSFISTSGKENGGNITVNTSGDVLLRNSRLFAAALNGGDILLHVQSPGRVVFDNSFASARATNKGGTVTIDPRVVALNNFSIIDGLAGTQPQPVTIAADGFLISDDSGILTTLPNFHPNLDLAKDLGRLSADLSGGVITLDDRCTSTAETAGLSSFVVTGKGGTAVEPLDWLPSFELSTTPSPSTKE